MVASGARSRCVRWLDACRFRSGLGAGRRGDPRRSREVRARRGALGDLGRPTLRSFHRSAMRGRRDCSQPVDVDGLGSSCGRHRAVWRVGTWTVANGAGGIDGFHVKRRWSVSAWTAGRHSDRVLRSVQVSCETERRDARRSGRCVEHRPMPKAVRHRQSWFHMKRQPERRWAPIHSRRIAVRATPSGCGYGCLRVHWSVRAGGRANRPADETRSRLVSTAAGGLDVIAWRVGQCGSVVPGGG